MNTKQKSANIGAKGWALVGYGMLAFLVSAVFWNNGIVNVVLTNFAELTGASTSTLLYLHTIIGYIIIPLNFCIGWLYAKFGTRKVLGISLAATAIAVAFYGHVSSIAQYVIIGSGIACAEKSYAQVGLGAMYAKYFPTKKGFVLGWATVGASATNIVSLPIFTYLVNNFGMNVAFYAFAIFLGVLCVVNFVFIPDDPTKMGYQPDNGDSDPKVLEAYKLAAASTVKVWTVKEAVRTKNFWFMVVGHSMLFMITTGIMMQIVPHMVANGIPQMTAVGYVGVLGIVGMISSAVSGWVDQKIGPRKTTMIMGISYALACFFLGAVPFSKATLFLALFFYCAVMGAISNLPTSHVISVFGSPSFSTVYGIFFPIMAIFSSSAPAILAFSTQRTGNLKLGYVIFAVLAIVGVVLVMMAADGMDKQPGEKPVAYKLKRGERKNQRVA